MQNTPFFSIIIPAYNAESFIDDTIISVLQQEFIDFELIIIDDGSSDKTWQQINSFDDPRIKSYQKKNGGVSSARNAGLRYAKGEYIAFLDADDRWSKMHLQFAYLFFNKNPEINWYCNLQLIKQKHGPFSEKKDTNFSIKNFHKTGIKHISSSNVIIRKYITQVAGLFPTDCKYGEDTVYWYKIGYHEPELGIGSTIAVHVLDHLLSSTKSLDRTNAPVIKCINYRSNVKIKHNHALQGIIRSLLTYHLRNRDFESFLQLTRIGLSKLSLRLQIKTIAQLLLKIINK
ncbi:MAG: glycosyltransferase family 2 protein [Carboxylicivirga sp.]|jgi:glycosyltransferase involved in cell wall biosynthesis|nr:glycosyltransferase family 2 protein [Carboxylicivirga sp.]